MYAQKLQSICIIQVRASIFTRWVEMCTSDYMCQKNMCTYLCNCWYTSFCVERAYTGAEMHVYMFSHFCVCMSIWYAHALTRVFRVNVNRVCACNHVHVLYMHMKTHIYIYMSICIYIHPHTYIYTCVCTISTSEPLLCTHDNSSIFRATHVRTHVSACLHMNICIYMYIFFKLQCKWLYCQNTPTAHATVMSATNIMLLNPCKCIFIHDCVNMGWLRSVGSDK